MLTISYFDKKTVGLDFEGMKADIKSAPEGSIVLLHACAHVSQFLQYCCHSECLADFRTRPVLTPPRLNGESLATSSRRRSTSPSSTWSASPRLPRDETNVQAYQGFASGDTLKDAFAVRYFVEQGHQLLLCQSFAKVSQNRTSGSISSEANVRTSVFTVNVSEPSLSSVPMPRRRPESTLN